jgi:hypothetical protein
MAHGDALEGKWRGNWRMESVASTLHTTSEHDVSSITTITTAAAHTSAASSRLNWHPRRFKWTRPFRRKTKSGFLRVLSHFKRSLPYRKNIFYKTAARTSDPHYALYTFRIFETDLGVWNIVAGVVTRLTTGWSGFRIPARIRISSILWNVQTGPSGLTQWVPRSLLPRIKRPGREVNNSPPNSAEDKNEGSYRSTSCPPVCFHGIDRHNLTQLYPLCGNANTQSFNGPVYFPSVKHFFIHR